MWGNKGQRQQSEPGQRNHSLCKTEGSANSRQAVRISGHRHPLHRRNGKVPDDQGLLSLCQVPGHLWAAKEHTPERCINSQKKTISEEEPNLLLHRYPSGKTEQAARADDVRVPTQRLGPCHTHSGISKSGESEGIPT